MLDADEGGAAAGGAGGLTLADALCNALGNVQLDTEVAEEMEEGTARGDRVKLMTVHASKGLEFDTVIVFKACDGSFPHALAKSEGRGREEQRLLFVAASRAKRRLLLTYPAEVFSWGAGGRAAPRDISPFARGLVPQMKYDEERGEWVNSGGTAAMHIDGARVPDPSVLVHDVIRDDGALLFDYDAGADGDAGDGDGDGGEGASPGPR